MSDHSTNRIGPPTPTWEYSAIKRRFVRKAPPEAGERDPWTSSSDEDSESGDDSDSGDDSESGDAWSTCSNFDCVWCWDEEAPVRSLAEDRITMEEEADIIPAERPLLHRYCENSYLRGTERQQYRNRWTVNYQRCHPLELRHFVLERGLKDPFPQGITLKYYYIRLLEQADREWSFPFMDLPPELRSHVYRPLLIAQTMPGRKDAFYPAILRTSKQIKHEAHSILYQENTFVLKYAIGMAGRVAVATFLNLPAPADCPHAKFLGLPKAIDDYPDYLRKVSQIEIVLSYMGDVSDKINEPQTWILNNYLYGLASFLMEGHALKTLRLEITGWHAETATDAEFQRILYPMRRLRNVANVIITTRLPDRVAKRLRKELQSHEPSFNTMRLWGHLDKEAKAAEEINQILSERCDERLAEFDFDFDIGGAFEDASAAHERVGGYAGMISCGNSQAEEQFMSQLSRLRTALVGIDVARFRSALQRFQKERRQRSQYEVATDDGRLEEADEIWGPKVDRFGHHHSAGHDEWSDDENQETATAEKETTTSEPPPIPGGDTASENHGDVQHNDQYPMLDSDQIEALFEEWASDSDEGRPEDYTE